MGDAVLVSPVVRTLAEALERLLKRRVFGKVTIEIQNGEVRNVHVDENHKPDQLTTVR